MKFEGMSLKKSFWRFIWPSVVAQWIFALYTMVDGMFVARGVSEVALSAVNIASPFVNFLFSVSILFAVGTSTIVAIFLGQENHREANRAYTQNLVVLGGISLVIMPGPDRCFFGSHGSYHGVCKTLYPVHSALCLVFYHFLFL